MWTVTEFTKSTVAVPAEHTKSFGVIVMLEPQVESHAATATVTVAASQLLSVFGPSTVHVVDGHELEMRFTTTGADWSAVGIESSFFCPTMICTNRSGKFRSADRAKSFR